MADDRRRAIAEALAVGSAMPAKAEASPIVQALAAKAVPAAGAETQGPSLGGIGAKLRRFLTADLEGVYHDKYGADAHYPTLRENAQSGVAAVGRGVGMSPEQAAGFSVPMTTAVENATPLGMLTSAEDAQQASKKGDYLGMVLGSLGAIPMAGKGGKVGEEAAQAGIRAFHGSPHSFDKFSLDKIGTGEGAQAYGHGLYFAENEGVAKGYRDALSTNTKWFEGDRQLSGADENAATILDWAKGDKNKALASVKLSRGGRVADQKYLDETEAAINRMDPAKVRFQQDPGSMYEVKINADPAHFLDWDKPLSGQSPQVQAAVRSMPNYARYADLVEHGDMGTLYKNGLLPGSFSPEGGSKALHQAGIPGIKYRDAGSRGGDGTKGTSNFVVFDDKLVEIVKKYGIAGALGAGLISQEMAQQMQAQGLGNGKPQS